MDYENQGTITLGDIEIVCQNLGLAHAYDNIKNLFKHLLHVSKGGLVIGEVKEFLLKSENSPKEELDDIFDYIDYDKQGVINKNKLKIILQELTGEMIGDNEAEDMIALLQDDSGELKKENFQKVNNIKIEIN